MQEGYGDNHIPIAQPVSARLWIRTGWRQAEIARCLHPCIFLKNIHTGRGKAEIERRGVEPSPLTGWKSSPLVWLIRKCVRAALLWFDGGANPGTFTGFLVPPISAHKNIHTGWVTAEIERRGVEPSPLTGWKSSPLVWLIRKCVRAALLWFDGGANPGTFTEVFYPHNRKKISIPDGMDIFWWR